MAEGNHEGAEEDPEDTDEFLYTDLDDNSGVFRLNPPPQKLDHCDLLLDAIDAQLSQLQVQIGERVFREHDCSDQAPLSWSQSLSKDTGFGSTTQINDTPMSCLDLALTKMKDQTSEKSTGSQEAPATLKEAKHTLDRTRDKEEMDSRREQVIWRLERLLGDACDEERMAGETQLPSDSICTEDFVRCFKEEMVDLTLPEGSLQQLSQEEEAERTAISDSAIFQSEQKRRNVSRRGNERNSKDTETARQSDKQGHREELQKCVCDSYRVKISDVCENVSAGERYKARKKLGDDSSISHRKEVRINGETRQLNRSHSPKAISLAGVPVWSFDTVSIDSDLDSVCMEKIRQHIHRRPGWHSLIQSVRDMDAVCSKEGDSDTPTLEESEPQPSSVQRSTYGNVHGRCFPLHKVQRKRRDTCRLVCSVGVDEKDTDEEENLWSRRCRPERTSGSQLDKSQSDWVKMKERLSILRQKCEEEEETLRVKRTQLNDVEFSLSELQQRKKHALQELERLSAETAQMEKERWTLESSLRESRAEKDSISHQLHKLQRQRESCLQQVRGMEGELGTLSQQRMLLKDGCMERKQTSVVMSVLEREEMERQLDNSKTELFAEQRRAREKLDSVQEKLEETCEELQRVTEAESSLRNTCASLEEKQKQKQDYIEALEFQVRQLQSEVEEYKIRLGSLEKSLAQKEVQTLALQEQHSVLQVEREELQGELQNLTIQHCTALGEAQEQAQKMMDVALEKQKKELAVAHEQQIQQVTNQAEEEKASALREQALSLTRHIETIQRCLQVNEEEAKKLRKSLEQQKKVATNREEELHLEALEKVYKAIEEMKSKWEAEKVEAIQAHCGILEEQNRKSLENVRSEKEREKRNAQALQHKVVELQTRVQELESESCAQQREQESVMAAICKTLKDEHQAELQRSHRHLAQQSQRTVLRLERAVQLAEEEADRLRRMLEERARQKQDATELQHQRARWAQELRAECQHLHLLLEQSGDRESAVQLPPSPTVAEAITNLKTLRERLKHLIVHLHQELDSQKQTTVQLHKDKERELHIQRQQLRMERDHALDSLKERLIQEHIEELSSLTRSHICDGGDEVAGVAASLRRQLEAKDVELRQVQRSMSQWKERTAARLACKFEEELIAELERCKAKLLKGRKTPKAQEERQRRPEEESRMKEKDTQNLFSFTSVHTVDSAATTSLSDVTSLKLLRYLQSRVKQLRVENQIYTSSPCSLKKIPLDLSGSYFKTGQDSIRNQSHSSTRTFPS
ncbi:hypothetical protein LDENG_00140360 [Lucifuga dentata]|nr:hypothetical protein LDENG_00140360 [Lucifuga dentata]